MGPLDLELNGNMLAFPMDAWNGDDEEVDLCNNNRLNIKENRLHCLTPKQDELKHTIFFHFPSSLIGKVSFMLEGVTGEFDR